MIKTMVANNLYIEYKVIFDEKEDLVYVPKDKALYAIFTGKVIENGKVKNIAKKRKLNIFDIVSIAEDSLWAERYEVLLRLNLDPELENDNPLIWVQPEDLVKIGFSEMLDILESYEKVVFFNWLGTKK